MPLAPGDRLGPYEILAPIGKGGMGEVYKARDTRLDRIVAVKTSRVQFSERFDREARAVAALNHPNICTLHDVGPNFLVMEFVEGASPKGPLPLDEVVRLARQITAALAEAHEKHITHRDLKPANILVRPDGSLKVLDFGLAKVSTPPRTDLPLDESPTLTMAATEIGMVLGTAAYMAPEQAKGKEVDKRADIWAFGVVLYELTTGKRPFSGNDISELLASVIKEQPDYSEVPFELRRIVKRCLEKDVTKRLRDIGDVWDLLDEPPAAPPEPVVVAAPPPRNRWLWPAVAGVAAMLAAGMAFLHFREATPEAPLRNAALLPPPGTDYEFAESYALPALSPDGKKLVYGARASDGKGPTQLWLRPLDSAVAQPLPGTEGALFPFWSPDSRYVAFGGTDRKLKKIDIQGGPPVPVTDMAGAFRGGSWSPEGVIVYGLNLASNTLMRVSSAGGKSTPATSDPEGKEKPGHRFPWFLPDGKHFLYVARSATPSAPNIVLLGSLDSVAPGTQVAEADSNAVYAQGHLLYLRGKTLMAQTFDADLLKTTDEAKPMVEGIPTYTNPTREAGFTVSTGGLLVYHTGGGGTAGQSRLIWLDRTGKQISTVGEPVQQLGDLDLSPDQKSALTSIGSSEANSTDLWIWDLARGLRQRFTFEGTNNGGIWSPDGNSIIGRSVRNGKNLMYRKASNGTGVEEVLFDNGTNNWPTSWHRDGQTILFGNTNAGGTPTGNDVWLLPLTPEPPGQVRKPKPFLQTNFNETRARFSPDGKWVAYVSNDSGKSEVFVLPYPGPGGKKQVSVGGGTFPRWRHDGKELYYTSPDGSLMAAEVSVRNGAFDVGKVQKLFGGVITTRGWLYDVSDDGQRFLLAREGEGPQDASAKAPAQPPLTLIENWTGLIKK